MIQSRSCEKTLMAPSTVYVNSPNSSSIFFKKKHPSELTKDYVDPQNKKPLGMTFLEKKNGSPPGPPWMSLVDLWGIFQSTNVFNSNSQKKKQAENPSFTHTQENPSEIRKPDCCSTEHSNHEWNTIILFHQKKTRGGRINELYLHPSEHSRNNDWLEEMQRNHCGFQAKSVFFWGGACFTTQLKILLPKSLVTQYSPNWDEKLANLVFAPPSFFPQLRLLNLAIGHLLLKNKFPKVWFGT